MIKIDTLKGLISTPSKKRIKKNSGEKTENFSGTLSAPSCAKTPSTESMASSSDITETLFMLQDISEKPSPEKKTYGYSVDLLSHLDHLHHDLLRGNLSERSLDALKKKLQEKPGTSSDETLEKIRKLIEQRVHIELAKRETP